MYIFVFWGEIKANVCLQEPAPASGWQYYLQALADIPFSGQRQLPQAEAFTLPQRICFGKLGLESAPWFILGSGV